MDFVKSAISSNLRLDGRKLDEQYSLNIIPNISSIAHGSSQVTFGDNIVQTTVNFSIVSPEDSAPDEGIIDLTITGTNIFENSDLSHKNYEILCNILYDLQFQHRFLDLKSLCILPGQLCWNLRIHSTVVKRGGCVIDALSIGVLSSLMCSDVPDVELMFRDELESYQRSNLQLKLSLEKNKIISHLVERLPLITSVGKVCKNHLWGMTREEELCSDGTMSIAVDKNGKCISVKANGSCFELHCIQSLINTSTKITLDNFNKLNKFIPA
ncbi:3' exoribonuclease domain 1 protein [Theileria parva strain Muguga]|uniref:3' exoribonuclease domain 1 protein n=1 Tax=Theileria parva strain Muguga TaxID=333668 RepID=UPI001C622480|nr:3' exoribonuclease domain 1 protein [Theileria parva strain Muguga]EAN34136.2 3' exoribonuclease domain 1 protein [Theileria parva strain Muguga]